MMIGKTATWWQHMTFEQMVFWGFVITIGAIAVCVVAALLDQGSDHRQYRKRGGKRITERVIPNRHRTHHERE